MAKDSPTWIPSAKFLRAVDFAVEWHGNDIRKIRQEPYIGHLLGVASLVIEYGGSEDQAIAAFLHDLLEDSPLTYQTLREVFGADIADMVNGCTDATSAEKAEEKKLPEAERAKKWTERKEKYLEKLTVKTSADGSVLVALADKVNNGEKSARDLKEDPELFKNFNADSEKQQWWYTGLVKAFNSGEKFTEHQKVLLRRFEVAVESMFPSK